MVRSSIVNTIRIFSTKSKSSSKLTRRSMACLCWTSFVVSIQWIVKPSQKREIKFFYRLASRIAMRHLLYRMTNKIAIHYRFHALASRTIIIYYKLSIRTTFSLNVDEIGFARWRRMISFKFCDYVWSC